MMTGSFGPTALTALGGADPLSELGAIRFTMACSMPEGTSPWTLAQQLVDQWHTIRRPETQEEYPAVAEAYVPASMAELGDEHARVTVLLVRLWAERPWYLDGEYRKTIMDVYEQARSWLEEQYPASGGLSIVKPVDDRLTDALVGDSVFTTQYRGSVPAGWADHLARHRIA